MTSLNLGAPALGVTEDNLVSRFIIAGPPATKERHRTGRGRTFTPASTVAAEQKVAWLFKSGLAHRELVMRDDLDYLLRIRLVYATRRHGDIDNAAKLVMDGLNKVGYPDDRQVVRLLVERDYDTQPITLVELYAGQPQTPRRPRRRKAQP